MDHDLDNRTEDVARAARVHSAASAMYDAAARNLEIAREEHWRAKVALNLAIRRSVNHREREIEAALGTAMTTPTTQQED